MTFNQQQFDVGIESEGLIIDVNGNGQALIERQPSSEWLVNRVKSVAPQLLNYISFEQASVMLEIKSAVFSSEELAIAQIQGIRRQINDLLADQGLQLSFQPVLTKPFDFLPATSDPNSRTHELIEKWSVLPEGTKMLDSTVTCSFQINDSRPFAKAKTDTERLEIGRRAHNLFGKNFDLLNAHNNPAAVDFNGMTRLQRATYLLTKVKEEQFRDHGFENPHHIVIPPFFADLKAMERWACAHSNVKDFSQADCKNEHAITVKIKRNPWVIETRLFDAVDSAQAMSIIMDINSSLLTQLN